MIRIRGICLLVGLALLTGCQTGIEGPAAPAHSLSGNPQLPEEVIRPLFKSNQWESLRKRPYDGYVILRGSLDREGNFTTDQVADAFPDNSRNAMAMDLSQKIQILPFTAGSNILPAAEVYAVFYEQQQPHLAYVFGKQVDTVGPSNASEAIPPALYTRYYGVIDLAQDATAARPQDILIEPETADDRPAPLLVFLHGMGNSPEQFEPLLRSFAENTGYSVFLPCGNVRMTPGEKGQARYNWDADRDPVRIIRKIRDLKGIDRDRIMIAGFSAGASMSYVTAVEDPDLFAGVVAFSGAVEIDYMSDAKVRQAATDLPVLIVHGTEDVIMPFVLGKHARHWFASHGFQVHLLEFGAGHVMPPNYEIILLEAMKWFSDLESNTWTLSDQSDDP